MMKQQTMAMGYGGGIGDRFMAYIGRFPKRSILGLILLVALLAFEIFNFDTTRYALTNLLGPVSFAGLGWATILAVAFCSIDFAGLIRLFTPESENGYSKESWYLMGAWLLGATMNALMTWWAVSLTLLNHEFGNEVLSRAELLQIVPIFVAVLVWLTRILFIGAITVAGEHLLQFGAGRPSRSPAQRLPHGTPKRQANAVINQPLPQTSDDVPQFINNGRQRRVQPGLRPVNDEQPRQRQRNTRKNAPAPQPNSRVRQRPPVPGARKTQVSARPRQQN